ncbi:peptide/nickel transport system ATP-binding protein [Providencia alcalifaciens]|nr:peptide/nickel transport system ATP-binding protein [Providencia alcalifaciens]
MDVRQVTQGTPVLQVEDLHVRFALQDADFHAVAGLSFTLHAGEIVALVGESGSGKSVTARTLVGLTGKNAQISAKRLSLIHSNNEIDLTQCREADWRKIRGREIGFVLQDALTSLDPLRKIGQEIAEPILTHRLSTRREVPNKVNELLKTVGIPDPVNRAEMYPHQLSGGLRQRALIASALAGQPRILIADEPTTALDATVQKQILDEFKSLAKLGIGILLITHDLSVVADIADRVIVMQHGRQRETGNVQQVLKSPKDPYTIKLLSSVPTRHSRGTWLTGRDPLANWPASMPSISIVPETVLAVENVSRAFRLPNGQKLQAVDDISLTVAKGETLGIVGESGSGKTTLGKLILALQTPDAGNIQLLNQSWSTLKERQRRPLRPRIQTIVQDPLSSFDPQQTVEQLLLQPLELHSKLSTNEKQQRIAELLSLVSLDSKLLKRRPTSLSGGQRQRVSIAQALACEPDILICDEPVSALDVTTQAQVLDLLLSLQQKLGLAMVFISHDLGVVQHISHRIVIMKSGQVVEMGDVDQIFAHPEHAYTKLLLSSVY